MVTYSVVMRDPDTGALGVGVQSHWFNTGRIVPWVRAGVGAVATQSVADPSYGPRVLDLLASGASAVEALASLVADDAQRDYRQVAAVDASGVVAAHTGALCIRHAGHEVGDGWSVQANIMRSDDVVPAMAGAALSGGPTLADRLLAVLEAAETAGGDLRGSQSAAILVVGDGPVLDIDLRVEDHPDPIGELRRLFDLHERYRHMGAGDDALAAGDHAAAAEHYDAAAQGSGANAEVSFWQGLGLVTLGRTDDGVAAMRRAVAETPDLVELLRRLPECGLADAEVVAAILEKL
jgi:uncharacterized Ntn-hydrolase superfamily protein